MNRAWVKYKINRGQEFVSGGTRRAIPLIALIVGYYEGERLLSCDGRNTMTVLEALAILEAATLECKKREFERCDSFYTPLYLAGHSF
jgi:hypothetical protein